MTESSQTGEFLALRPRLVALAYRMLGSAAQAEDVVQDAFLRWHQADRAEIRTPGAWLTATVSRLAIDQLRSDKARRTDYVGPWLPEPVATDSAQSPIARSELAFDLSMAMLIVLERLTADERAVYILREVFDYDFAELAGLLGRSEASCRQLLHRAREHVRSSRPRFAVAEDVRRRLLERFVKASREGDLDGLLAILTPDATLASDGGGKAAAARNVIRGADRVARFVLGIRRKFPSTVSWREINGEPGLYVENRDGPPSVMTFDLREGRIVAIHIVRNPDKLKFVTPAS